MRQHILRLTFLLALAAALLVPASAHAIVLPTGFQESTVFNGLTNPTAVRFSPDGRVFVAEKSGLVKVFDSVNDSSPTTVADLRTNVHNFWDRGLLGLALAPNFPADPHIYVLYTHDAAIGATAPRWGTAGATSDPCPSPPGATSDGCVVSGRLSRLTIAGDVMTGAENVLINDWCQQYPSHSVGSMTFGADGMLYVSAGDGASFNFADWGQDGNPVNPCGDPPGGVGSAQSPPTAQGGALRAQDLRTTGDAVSLDGAILRIDPVTGEGKLDNPLGLNGDVNAKRIVAHGLRNPFRITTRPGTNEIWAGDVGWSTWEEINRIQFPVDGTVDNFGWPCYEGNSAQPSYNAANLDICENLYAQGANATSRPYYTYDHGEKVVPNEACPGGSSSIAGLAFYTGGSYPDHDGGLFFADYSRKCIWFMRRGSNGLPDPNQISTFGSAASGPVDLQTGPGGDLFYVDFDGGTVRRIRYTGSNQAPTAVAQSDTIGGPTPLTVNFNGTASSDPEGSTLAYAWDLDDDGAFDDSASATPSFTYTQARSYTVRLRVTDPGGAIGTDVILITAGNNTAPAPSITSPAVGTTWKVGDPINFTGTATDAEDGTLPASALSWELIIQHCPSNCHTHPMQTFPGVASGSFSAPDHEYPSYLELKLTATDSNGAKSTTTLPLHPRTVDLTFQSSPTGLQLASGPYSGPAPFTATAIVGSTQSISAPSPQTRSGRSYTFESWSDGGAATHNIVAPASPTTYTATLREAQTPAVAALPFDEGSGTTVIDSSGNGNNGTINGATWSTAGRFGNALSFDGVDDRVVIPDSDHLDFTDGMTLEAYVRPSQLGTRWRTVLFKAQPGNHVYAVYGNQNTTRPLGEAFIGGAVRQAPGTGALPLDAWSHLTMTYDGSSLRLYVGGNLVTTTPFAGSVTTSAGELWIGGNPVWPEWFAGLIDEVRLYNRALTQAEIQQDMTRSVGVPDAEPPASPSNFTAVGGLGHVKLDWTASTDNVGVHHYNVHRSQTPNFTPGAANRIAQPNATTYTDSGLPAGTYYYRVTAEDAAGNLSTATTQASAAATADTSPPAVSVTAPAAGATVNNTVTLTASASDNVSVASVQFTVDGVNAGAADTTAPYSIQWDSRSVANGPHDIAAVARDPSNNTRTSDTVAITVQNAAAPPPSGLVAEYGFDEASGGSVSDNSGNGNGGSIEGATWVDGGRYGKALSFDGVNDKVTVADSNSLDLTAGMTLEAWVRPTAAGGRWRTAIAKENGTKLSYALYPNRNTNVPNVEIMVGSALRPVNGTSQLPLDQWTHVAGTYDSAAIRLYVNGTQVGTATRTGAITTSTGPLSLGGNAAFGEWFQGLLDEVRIYNRALTVAEIQADMTRSVGVPDTQAPTAPGSVTAAGGLGSVKLDWTAASDNVGVRRYNVHRSTTAGFTPTAANRIAQPTATTYTDAGLAAGTYHYVVTAEDTAGNIGPLSNYATGTATADTTLPTVAVTAPAAGATVANTVTLSANASDDDAVQSVQFKVDGADVGAPDTTAPYSVQWDSFSVANGDRDVTALARDRSGNTKTSDAVRVKVQNSAAPPDPDLVAAYGFDEGQGTAVRDESGKNNGGTSVGAVWVPGRFGHALDFDGVDDEVVVPDSNTLDLTTGMTVSAYVRPDALASRWRTVAFKERTGNLVYSLYANRNTNVPVGEVTTGTSTVTAVNGVSSLSVLGTWSHLAVTYDGASLRLFVDGVQVSTVARTGAMPTSTGALRIGANAVWGERFDGAIDELRIYKRAQTAAQIQADMGRSVSTPDTEPPTAASGLTANGGIGTVALSWTAGTDNIAVAGYDVHRSTTAGFTPSTANRIAQPSGTSYTDNGLAAGTYHYKVVARDQAGNLSPASNEASGTASADTTPPSVSLTEPGPGATLVNSVTVRANASDNGSVANVQFLLDGQLLNAADSTDPYSTTWNTRTASNGTHVLSARATDAAGLQATSAPVSVTVDNTAAPPEGLVAGYGFDEGTGTSVSDVSANNNVGTIAGATWTTGRYGSALSFDGVDDMVTVPDSNSLDLTTGMTVSAYVRPRTLGTAWRTVLMKERSGNLVYALYANQNTSVPIGEITVGTAVSGVRGTTQLPLNAWRHLAVTYDGANLRLYVDGAQVGTLARTGPLTTSTGALRIGANSIWGERFDGLIDEVRVYNRALVQAEIEADMAVRVARDVVAPTVTARTPASGATGVPVSATPTATFSEAMDPATITTTTFELADGAGTKVPATVSYDVSAGKATLNPSSALRFDTTYTATVRGGASGDRAKDQAGNALAANHSWSFTTEPPPPPVLLVHSGGNPFSSYAGEILKAEGVNDFVKAPTALIDTSYLSNFDVVVIGDSVALSDADVADFTSYVHAGGNVVALRPDKKLAGLLGLTDAGATLSEGYMKVEPASGHGAGIAGETMQFHGTADRYALNGATAVATLYSSATAATANPAVSLRNVGALGGQAMAFTYDLARSVVFTRQGNPAWAGQDRDGINPIRTNDLFFGGMAGDLRPDWIDTNRIHIPQADEQQRLLANLIVSTTSDRKPLPRFWYLPRGEKAAVVMTGDDHSEGGTGPRFDQYKAASPPGCSVANWECVRGTSYLYPAAPLTDAQAAAYEAEGFEVSIHINVTGGPCGNFTPAGLTKEYNDNLRDFAAKYVSVPKPLTERTHCVSWSDWASQPQNKAAHGIRLDTNYYHYPTGWIGAKPGFMTGSAIPMRFADVDGTTFDVFQAHTHMNDEAGQQYPFTVNTLLDRALGPEGYYGAFTANMHTDEAVSEGSDAIVASALARDVPVITARQLVNWVDGRESSSFRSVGWNAGTLSFTVAVGAGANGLQGMLPLRAGTRTLSSITRGGTAVPFTTRTIKGIEYGFFNAAAGAHQAVYTP